MPTGKDDRLRVLGILNVTPDSFSDGGAHLDPRVAVARAHALANAGATALDVGGESTRPGSDAVSVGTEMARILPVLDALGDSYPIPISVDTRRAAVLAAAAERGATILNDTSALCDDPEIAVVAAEHGMTVILMHRQGTPATMQMEPRYDDVIAEVRAYFEERVDAARAAGISDDRLILDPGLGFGKRPRDNYELMRSLDQLRIDGLPMLVGASRKSFLGLFDDRPFEDRLSGSLAFTAAARSRGAEWIRVHDVEETVVFLRTLDAIDAGVREGATP